MNNGLPVTFSTNAMAVIGPNTFAGTDHGVFLTKNNGVSWSAVNIGLTNTVIESLATDGTNLFAGTNDGVFLSTNMGTAWSDVSEGMPRYWIQSLQCNDSYLFAGPSLRAAWKRPLSELVAIHEVSANHNTLNISPNPASDRITIECTAPHGFLSLSDLSGRILLREQVTQNKTTLNISTLPRGVYVVQWTNDHTIAMGKVVIN